MAAKILTGESKVEEMPIEYAPEFTKEYNLTIAEALGKMCIRDRSLPDLPRPHPSLPAD